MPQREIQSALNARDGQLWVDVEYDGPADGDFLGGVSDFHPLAIEDCGAPVVQVPKVEDYGDHVFIVACGIDYITEAAERYYRDIYDTILRLEGQNDNLRERADTALSIYLLLVTNKQNDLMKVLSVVATVFLPLTLLAGIYGLNFEYIPELGWRWGYFVVLGVMAAVIVGVLWAFWARQWFSLGRKRLVQFRPRSIARERLNTYIAKLGPGRIWSTVRDPRNILNVVSYRDGGAGDDD